MEPMKGRNLLVQPKGDCCSHSPAAHGAHEPNASPTVIDPACGMRVDPATAAGHYEYRGTTYYFCGLSYLERFKAAPESFLGVPEDRPAAAIEAGEYVCPMDPEVRQDHPGACPKCGMALEPAMPRPGDGDYLDLSDASRDRARGAGELPDLRHGPRASRRNRRGAQPRARRHAFCTRGWACC